MFKNWIKVDDEVKGWTCDLLILTTSEEVIVPVRPKSGLKNLVILWSDIIGLYSRGGVL